MAPDGAFLEDHVVLQGFGPLNEALHSGVAHVRPAFVVPWYRRTEPPPPPVSPVLLGVNGPLLQLHPPVMKISVSQLLVRYGGESST